MAQRPAQDDAVPLTEPRSFLEHALLPMRYANMTKDFVASGGGSVADEPPDKSEAASRSRSANTPSPSASRRSATRRDPPDYSEVDLHDVIMRISRYLKEKETSLQQSLPSPSDALSGPAEGHHRREAQDNQSVERANKPTWLRSLDDCADTLVDELLDLVWALANEALTTFDALVHMVELDGFAIGLLWGLLLARMIHYALFAGQPC